VVAVVSTASRDSFPPGGGALGDNDDDDEKREGMNLLIIDRLLRLEDVDDGAGGGSGGEGELEGAALASPGGGKVGGSGGEVETEGRWPLPPLLKRLEKAEDRLWPPPAFDDDAEVEPEPSCMPFSSFLLLEAGLFTGLVNGVGAGVAAGASDVESTFGLLLKE